MRVLVISYEWPPIGGGMGRRVREYVGSLPKEVKVDVVTSATYTVLDNHYSSNVNICSLAVKKKDPMRWTAIELLLWSWKAKLWAKRIYKDRKHDVIHVFGGMPGVFISPDLNKTIVSLSGSDVPGFSDRTSLLYKIIPYKSLMRRCVLVANSEHFARMAENVFKIDIGSIPTPYTTRGFVDGPRNGKAIYIARDVPRKQIKKAFEVAEKSRVPLDVICDEQHQRVKELLPNYSYYLCTSKAEGMSMAMIEAMDAGLPVITSPCGGHDELVINYVTGLCSRLLISSLSIAKHRTWDRRTIHDHVNKVCQPEKVVNAYMKLYKEIK